jgi:hypothetical protein
MPDLRLVSETRSSPGTGRCRTCARQRAAAHAGVRRGTLGREGRPYAGSARPPPYQSTRARSPATLFMASMCGRYVSPPLSVSFCSPSGIPEGCGDCSRGGLNDVHAPRAAFESVASRRSAILVGLDVRLDMEATHPVVELPCQLGDGSAWHVKQRLDLVRHEPNSECETRPDWVQKEIPPESGIFAREMCESAHPTWSRDPLARSGRARTCRKRFGPLRALGSGSGRKLNRGPGGAGDGRTRS